MSRRRPWLVGLVGLVVLLGSCGPAGPEPEAELPPGKVTILGIDAANWSVLRPLLRRGALPAMEGVIRGGVRAPLETLDPTVSVVIWTTIATGQLPEKHGIYNWTRGSRDRLGGQLAITSNLRKTPALWNVAGREGRSSLVVNWWASWPSETIPGAVVSNLVLRGTRDRVTYPQELAERITGLARPPPWKILDPNRKAPPEIPVEAPSPFLAERLADELILSDAALDLERELQPDLMALYLRSLDLLQHEYWDQIEPEAFPEAEAPPAGLEGIVRRYHRKVDELVSRVVEGMASETTLILCSDHGMEAIRELPPAVEGLDLDRLLIRLGLLSLRQGIEVDPEGTVAKDAGRLPPGLKRTLRLHPGPQEDRAALRRRVREHLAEVHTLDGRPLFTRIRPAETEDEDLELTLDPELDPTDTLLVAGDAVPVRDLLNWIMHPRTGQHWHAPPGVLLAAGPDIRRNARLEGPRVQDVAPTALWCMGLPLAEDLDGRLLSGALREGVLERRPPRRVASFGQRDAETTPPVSVADGPLLEELKSLGYVH